MNPITRPTPYLRWLFTRNEAIFVWCVVGAFALIGAVYVLQRCWLPELAIAYQMAGTAIAFFQVLSLREALSVKTVRRLLVDWFKSYPRAHDATGNLVAAESRLDGFGTVVREFNKSFPLEEQVSRIWQLIEEHERWLSRLHDDAEANRRQAELALKEVRENLQRKLDELQHQFSEAVTSSPFMAFYGVVLLVVGLGLQLWLSAQPKLFG